MDNRLELEDRTCDALITGFLPQQSIHTIYKKSFYVPSSSDVCEILGSSLGDICGRRRGSNFGVNVDWGNIKVPGVLNEKVIAGLKKSTFSWRDEYSLLDYYLFTCNNPLLEYEWVYGLGGLYRYRDGERKKAIERAADFWKPEEMDSFRQIHKVMRNKTKEMFEARRR